MIQFTSALLAGAFLITSCTPTKPEAEYDSKKSGDICVAGFVEDTPGKGTLDIYTKTIGIESISNVSIEIAKDIAANLGAC